MRRPKDYWHAAAIEAADQWNVRIWGCRELQELQRQLADQRLIPRSTSLENLEAVLTERGRLQRVELHPVLDANGDNDERASTRRPFRRLVWGDVSTFEIAQALRPRSYLSHGSAMILNGLVDTLNDRVARTLVDIAVRPGYAGGARRVLDAYRSALARNDAGMLIDELTETLNALSHVYPYHQAVGFYVEKAGADEAVTAPLRARGLAYDFYLDYAMESPRHDSKWRVYYPAGLL